jgi:hypothetical protein
MSVDHDALLAIGKVFRNTEEAIGFLHNNKILIDITDEELDQSGLEDNLPGNLQGSPLNFFTGYGYYLGFKIRCDTPNDFKWDYYDGIKQWEEMFPNEPYDIVHTVISS